MSFTPSPGPSGSGDVGPQPLPLALPVPGPAPVPPPAPKPAPAVAPPKPRPPKARPRARSADDRYRSNDQRFGRGPRGDAADPFAHRPTVRPLAAYRGRRNTAALTPQDKVALEKMRYYISLVIGYYTAQQMWRIWTDDTDPPFQAGNVRSRGQYWDDFERNVMNKVRLYIRDSYRTYLQGNPVVSGIDPYHMKLLAEELNWEMNNDQPRRPSFNDKGVEFLPQAWRQAIEKYANFLLENPDEHFETLRHFRDQIPYVDPENVHHQSFTPPWLSQESQTPGTVGYDDPFQDLPTFYFRRKAGQPAMKQFDWVTNPPSEVFDLNRAMYAEERSGRTAERRDAREDALARRQLEREGKLRASRDTTGIEEDEDPITDFTPAPAPAPTAATAMAPVTVMGGSSTPPSSSPSAMGWAESVGILPRGAVPSEGVTGVVGPDGVLRVVESPTDAPPIMPPPPLRPDVTILTPGVDSIVLPDRSEEPKPAAVVDVDADPDATQMEDPPEVPDEEEAVPTDALPVTTTDTTTTTTDPLVEEFQEQLNRIFSIGTVKLFDQWNDYPQRNTLEYTHNFAVLAFRHEVLVRSPMIRNKFGHLPQYQNLVQQMEGLLDATRNPFHRWVYDYRDLLIAGVLSPDATKPSVPPKIHTSDVNRLYDLDIIRLAVENGLFHPNADQMWLKAYEKLSQLVRTPVQYDILHILDTWRRQFMDASHRNGRMDYRLIDSTKPSGVPTLPAPGGVDIPSPPPHLLPWTDTTYTRSPEYWLFTLRWQYDQDYAHTVGSDQPEPWLQILSPVYRQRWTDHFAQVPPLFEGDTFRDAGPFPMDRLRDAPDPYENFLRFQEGTWEPLPREILGAATSPPEEVVVSSREETTGESSVLSDAPPPLADESWALVPTDAPSPEWSAHERAILEEAWRQSQEQVRRLAQAGTGSSQNSSLPLFTQGSSSVASSSTQLSQPSSWGSTPDFDPSGRVRVSSIPKPGTSREAVKHVFMNKDLMRRRMARADAIERDTRKMDATPTGPRLEMAPLPQAPAPQTPPQTGGLSQIYGPAGQPSLTSQFPLSQPLPGPVSSAPSSVVSSLTPSPAPMASSPTPVMAPVMMGPSPPPGMSVSPITGVTGFAPSSLPPPPASLATPDAIPRPLPRSQSTPEAIPAPVRADTPVARSDSSQPTSGSTSLFSTQPSQPSQPSVSATSSPPLFTAGSTTTATTPATPVSNPFFTPASAYVRAAATTMDSQSGPTPILRTEDHPDYVARAPARDTIHPATARRITFDSIREHYVQRGIYRPSNRIRDEIVQGRLGPPS